MYDIAARKVSCSSWYALLRQNLRCCSVKHIKCWKLPITVLCVDEWDISLEKRFMPHAKTSITSRLTPRCIYSALLDAVPLPFAWYRHPFITSYLDQKLWIFIDWKYLFNNRLGVFFEYMYRLSNSWIYRLAIRSQLPLVFWIIISKYTISNLSLYSALPNVKRKCVWDFSKTSNNNRDVSA